ncbi:MAG: uroporphyrinogen-III C-methyltransferase [Sneathiella sp.]|uniref:uroporphyrinogen-III C-methyltransferase n=1 Tax=Sneathiella sp. TaxID=1964365 RepID=UPI000C441F8B|nr:uroporphyrinogen-III C-methyltransferase [Sneathiella sp.]MAZ04201.1 uroporphyrinogen-III C-methyltransferase [Sneathiella sp.]
MDKILSKIPPFEPGSVWLVGAGPGDAGLLTLYAYEALRQADVLVYDALVGQDILELTGPGTILEYAGKRGGKPSPKQNDITERLIALAREGKRVIRLKGGDPYIFGRGGEEALTLAAHNIPFRVIPGISSGVGGLAYAGIPLTHRETNSAVTFLTGHDASGEVPDVNWEYIAKGSPVIVVYMGVRHIRSITERLIRHGRSQDESVAIVFRATTKDQKIVVSTLANAAQDVEKSNLKPPALIVIGEVVKLRPDLDWFDRYLASEIED